MIFLESDWEKVEEETRVFEWCTDRANKLFDCGEYAEAQLYLNNATRALTELDRLRKEKEMNDQAWFLLKQIEGQQQVDNLIASMKVKQ